LENILPSKGINLSTNRYIFIFIASKEIKMRKPKEINRYIRTMLENELKPAVKKDLLYKRLTTHLQEVTRKDSDNFPGKVETDKTLKIAGNQNSDALDVVADKIKSYLNFKNNSHPNFPHQNNSKTDYESPMYRNNTDQEEYVDDWRGSGLEDAQYQTEPSDGFKKRVRDYIEGATTTGNETEKGVDGEPVGNVVSSDLGKNVLKKVKRKYSKLKSDEWDEAIPNRYGKQKPNPNYMVTEALRELKEKLLADYKRAIPSNRS
jgi:hypothetical protein